MSSFEIFLQPLLSFLSQDSTVRIVQLSLLFAGSLIIFLLFYTLRDVLLRSRSFWFQLLSIVLVAFLPVIGFFLYLLIRPARTIKEREMATLLEEIHAHEMFAGKKHAAHAKDKEEKKEEKKA